MALGLYAAQDAFPPSFVQQNRFQRQATLLLYLNDVEEGGCTHFDQLNLSIHPKCGKALLFFPAFSNGTPDPRCALLYMTCTTCDNNIPFTITAFSHQDRMVCMYQRL